MITQPSPTLPVAEVKHAAGASLTDQHLAKVREFYNGSGTALTWASRSYRKILARYYNLAIPPDASVLEIGCGTGELLRLLNGREKAGLDLSERQIAVARVALPSADLRVGSGEHLPDFGRKFDYIVISDTLNFAADVQQLLERLHAVSHNDTRLLLNFHSALWRPLGWLADRVGLRSPHPHSSWLASSDVLNLLDLADWRKVTLQPRMLIPFNLPVVERLVNRWLAPLLPWLCLTIFCVARPRTTAHAAKPMTVSVIIPARNEAGNIEAAVRRTPQMGAGTEIIFVEGHSRDHTWPEIQRVVQAYPERAITALQQTGRGKGDAVRLGFAQAKGDILMILDADLTMPPEELPKFYNIVASGRADFANGVRLVYPMDEKAMQFLNLCANKAFGIIFSWLLGQPVKDTLCGTKVLTREHYARLASNRHYFGSFDPFGDFDLLFGAAKLNLKIADVPIRYKERTYGETNIQRWRHGWLLLRMVLFAARKLKFV